MLLIKEKKAFQQGDRGEVKRMQKELHEIKEDKMGYQEDWRKAEGLYSTGDGGHHGEDHSMAQGAQHQWTGEQESW